LTKPFSATIEKIKTFLSLLLLICCIMCNDLHMVNHPCICGIKQTSPWSWYFWCVVKFSLPIFLRIFCS
jgi:hypothetical protein